LTAFRHNHEFWASGSLRCILVAQKTPPGYIVQVLNKGTPITYERCESDDHAAEQAEHFRKLFTDP
jgi:hypothetical protein